MCAVWLLLMLLLLLMPGAAHELGLHVARPGAKPIRVAQGEQLGRFGLALGRLALLGAQLGALGAERSRRLRVALLVQSQVVGTRERLGAEVALERPVAGVFALVPRELVGPSESRVAIAKVA